MVLLIELFEETIARCAEQTQNADTLQGILPRGQDLDATLASEAEDTHGIVQTARTATSQLEAAKERMPTLHLKRLGLRWILPVLLLGTPPQAAMADCSSRWLLSPSAAIPPYDASVSSAHSTSDFGVQSYLLNLDQGIVDDWNDALEDGCLPLLKFSITEVLIPGSVFASVILDGEFYVVARNVPRFRETHLEHRFPDVESVYPKRELRFYLTGAVPVVGEVVSVQGITSATVEIPVPFLPPIPLSMGAIGIDPASGPLLYFE